MQEKPPSPLKSAANAGRFVGAIFGLVFAGIGVTVIASLWFGEMAEGAPTFFKLVGSFIALAFVAMGSTLAIGSLFGGNVVDHAQTMIEQAHKAVENGSTPPTPAGPGSYVCPNCSATLTRADVSPLGDVKCTFCGGWFNIHGRK